MHKQREYALTRLVADDISYIDAPGTPAPVFAVRAFKHAIWGTPQQASDSNPTPAQKTAKEANARDGRNSRSIQAQKPGQSEEGLLAVPTIQGSPSKPAGILLTPGTLRRNKTVTFGAQVKNNEGKAGSRPHKSGTPKDIPGKFPSPSKNATMGMDFSLEPLQSSQTRTRLTEKLHEAREVSNKLDPKLPARAKDDTDITLDVMEPRSQSGRYWKQEYESYAAKSKREVQKLLHKSKAAKSFAMEKDQEVMRLAEELRQERRKVEKLEARSMELEAQMKEYQMKLHQGASGTSSGLIKRLETTKISTSTPSRRSARKSKLEQLEPNPPREMSNQKPSNALRDTAIASVSQLRAQLTLPHGKSLPDEKQSVDIWADMAYSSPLVVNASEKGNDAMSPQQSPLRQRDINTLDVPSSKPTPAFKPQHEDQRTPQKRSESARKQAEIDQTRTLLDTSMDLPIPSPEPAKPLSATRSLRRSSRKIDTATADSSFLTSFSPPKYDRFALPFGTVPPTSKVADYGYSNRKNEKEHRLVNSEFDKLHEVPASSASPHKENRDPGKATDVSAKPGQMPQPLEAAKSKALDALDADRVANARRKIAERKAARARQAAA